MPRASGADGLDIPVKPDFMPRTLSPADPGLYGLRDDIVLLEASPEEPLDAAPGVARRPGKGVSARFGSKAKPLEAAHEKLESLARGLPTTATGKLGTTSAFIPVLLPETAEPVSAYKAFLPEDEEAVRERSASLCRGGEVNAPWGY